jgi:hypothetical protein
VTTVSYREGEWRRAKLMQWVALTVWVVVAMLALPLSRGVAYGRASLGVQALAGIAGLALMVEVAAGGALALGWWAGGCGALGVVAVGVAAAGLTSEQAGVGTLEVERLEEHEAGLAGVQLLLFGVATICSVMVALNVGMAS